MVDSKHPTDKKEGEKVMASRTRTIKDPAKPGTLKRSDYIKAALKVVAERNPRAQREHSQQFEEANLSQTVDSKQSSGKKGR